MDALNGMAVSLSGLVFAGAAALTVGASIPASAGVVVSTPHTMISDDEDEGNQAISQANHCGNGEFATNVNCQNLASQIQGDENKADLDAEQFPFD